MCWYYRNFPRHSVPAENSEIRGRNNILSNYHYRVDLKLGKGVCSICHMPCAWPEFISQIDKYWFPKCAKLSQPRYFHVENGYYKKTL